MDKQRLISAVVELKEAFEKLKEVGVFAVDCGGITDYISVQLMEWDLNKVSQILDMSTTPRKRWGNYRNERIINVNGVTFLALTDKEEAV